MIIPFLVGAATGFTAGWAVATAVINLSRHGLGEPYL